MLRQRPSEEITTDKKSGNQVMNKATETYEWWNNLATLNPEDSIGLSIMKIGIRVIGIIFLIAISPVVLAGALIAFMAAL